MSAQPSLTGGDGIPSQRGEKLPENLFLLRPQNHDYLSGKEISIVPTENEMEARRLSLMWLLIPAPIFCGLTAWSWSANVIGSGVEIFVIFIVLGLIYGVITWVSSANQRSTLTQDGVLLIGEIESIKGEWKVQNRVNFYFVTVTYYVRLPDNRVLNDAATAIYMDMVGKPLPERGTPVAVLYINDSEKMLL